MFIHNTVVLDENVTLGSDISIWHFCHIMSGSNIGDKSILGQNVMIGKNVKVGKGCKIQNNVSVYEGVELEENVFCGRDEIKVKFYNEKLPNGKSYKAAYTINHSFKNSDKFLIPEKHYFFLGDNRDCSKDSRFLSEVGYVHEDNLVGKAQFLFFSSDYRVGSIFKFWDWKNIIRFKRFFKKIN